MLRILALTLVSLLILSSPALTETLLSSSFEGSKLYLEESRLDGFREPTYGGGGHFFMSYMMTDFDVLNKELVSMGIPGLSDGFYLWGGGGYGTITPRLRIGGMGAAGVFEALN